MPQLKIDLIIDDNGAVQNLAQVETGMSRVGKAAELTATQLDAVKKQLQQGIDPSKVVIPDEAAKSVQNYAQTVAVAAKRTSEDWGALGKSMHSTGREMSSIGRSMSVGLTAPIVALGGFAIKAAMDFETSFTGVRKTVKATEAQFAALESGVRQLARTIPVGVNELNKIMQLGGQMGVGPDNLMRFTKSVAAFMEAQDSVGLEQAALGVARLTKLTGAGEVHGENAFDVIASSIVRLGNEFEASEGEIMNFSLRIAAIGQTVGLTAEQIIGIGGAFTSLGVKAEMGGTAVMTALDKMNKAVVSGDMAKLGDFGAVAGFGGASAGKDFQGLWREDPGEAFTRFVEGLASAGSKAGLVLDALGLKNQRIRLAFLSAAQGGDQLRRAIEQATDAGKTQDAHLKEAEIRWGTTAKQLKLFANNLVDAAIGLGQQLIPHLMRMKPAADLVLAGVVGLVAAFSQMPPWAQAAAIGFVGFVAALGPVIWSIGQVVTVGGTLLKFLGARGLIGGLGAVAPAATGARLGLASLYTFAAAHPFLAITAAVGALVFALGKLKGAWDNAVQAHAQGGWKAVIGELGRNVNNDDLSFFKDWRVDQQTRRRGGAALGSALPEIDPRALAGGAAAAAARQALEDQAAGFGTAGTDTKRLPADLSALLGGDDNDAARKAAEKAAADLKKKLDDLSGRTAISVAAEWVSWVKQIGGVTQMAAKDQEAYNKALGEGLDAMLRMGKAVDPKMFSEWVRGLTPAAISGLPVGLDGTPVGLKDTQTRIPTITDLPGLFSMPSPVNGLSQLPGTQMAAPVPPQVDLLNRIFGTGMQFGEKMGAAFSAAIIHSRSLVQFFSNLGSNIFGTLGSDLGKHLGGMAGKLGGMLGGALGAILPGIGGMIGSLAGPLINKLFGPTEYEQRVRAANDERAQIRSSMDMSELQRQADFTGRQDLLTGVTSGLATNNDPEYIRSLLTDLQAKTQELQAAMDRYGISWEDLGEKAKQSQINQMAEQFILDFQLLTQAGADVNFVIEKMGSSVNEFVQTALRTGTEVPIAMQPMLQKMVDMGILTDANGEALKDLSSISFGETLTQGISRVVEAINHLTRALGYELPNAAREAADGMNAAFDSVRPPRMSGHEPPEDGGVDPGDDLPRAHTGGLLWRRMHSGGLAADEVPIIGQTGEFMMSRRGVRANGVGVLEQMNAGRMVTGGGGSVVVHVNVEGSIIRERDLGDTVTKVLIDRVRELGLA